MDKAKREELLRQRFKARKPSGSRPVAKTKAKRQEDRGPKAGRMAQGSFGLALAWNWGRTEWVQKPNAMPDPSTLRLPRSGDEPTPFTKIAAQLPKKLLLKRCGPHGGHVSAAFP